MNEKRNFAMKNAVNSLTIWPCSCSL